MADQYANIIIDISHEDVDRVFQYRIPPALLPQIRVGVQVCVPFGSGNRTRTGYVVELTDKPDYDKEKIKEIISVTEKSITADTRLIELAWWMKEQYGSTMNQALKTVLPVKKRVKARNKKIVETVAEQIARGAKRAGMKAEYIHFEENRRDALAEAIRAKLQPGDCVLLKGSNSMKLGEVVAKLLKD